MPTEYATWLAILLITGLTLFSRLIGPLLMQRLDASPFISRLLDVTAASVIAALVASIVARGGLREVSAVLLAAAVALRSRSAVLAMVAGMALAAFWTAAA
ncbi:MAG: AzlD domain-containing protein [Pseudomonadota bacterium]